MARPREFDVDTVIQKAMDVFWTHSYQGSSLPDLLDAMEITRGSFYKAFGDKKSLFMIAMDLYDKEAVAPAVSMLSDKAAENGWERIMLLFNLILENVRNGDRRGCLVCTAAAGAAFDDAEISHAVAEALEKLRMGFETALHASNPHAHLSPDKRRDLSDALISQYIGFRILARSQSSIEMLERSVTSIQHLMILPTASD